MVMNEKNGELKHARFQLRRGLRPRLKNARA